MGRVRIVQGSRAAGLLLGAVADVVLGDPRRWHPVAGFGTVAGGLERRVYADRRAAGAGYVALLVGGAVALGAVAEAVARRPVGRMLVTAAATWVVLGGASLAREGAALAGELERGDLGAARARLPGLCGRDPAALDAGGLARAATESVAENTSDAVVAPLLWGALAGVPGLLGYRAVNTLDAMVGHRSPRYLRFGWAAARLDDVANLAPARLGTAALIAGAALVGEDGPGAARVAWAQHRRTASPNAGWPMAAMAGALGIGLAKRGVYRLGEGALPSSPEVIRRARRVLGAAAVITVAFAAVVALVGRRAA